MISRAPRGRIVVMELIPQPPLHDLPDPRELGPDPEPIGVRYGTLSAHA